MEINTNSETKNLVAVFEINSSLLQEKLNLLFELKACVFECILNKRVRERFNFSFDSIINNGNVFTRYFVITTFAKKSDQLVCVFDFDIANFIRKWLVTFRASDCDCNTFFHSHSLNCRGD